MTSTNFYCSSHYVDGPPKTALLARDKILAIRALMIKTLGFAKEKLPSQVYSKDLIELLFYQPDTK